MILLAIVGVIAGCSRGDGTVWDAHGSGAADCHVAAIQLRDENGQVPQQIYRYLTTSNPDGRFELPVLPAGTHLLVALQPILSATLPFDLDEALNQAATGGLPESCLVGRQLLSSDGKAAWTGITLQLGCPPNQGRHVRGRLSGDFHPDEFTYEVTLSMRIPGVRPPSNAAFAYDSGVQVTGSQLRVEWTPPFSCIPAADGTFDLGWVPSQPTAVLYISAGPEPGAGGLVNERVDLSGSEIVLDRELPALESIRVRLTGAVSYGFGEAPYLAYSSPADSSVHQAFAGRTIPVAMRSMGGSHVVHEESGLQIVLREGTHVLYAYDDKHDLVSRLVRVQVAKGQVTDDMVLPLESCPTWTARLVDKAGKSHWPGLICVGAEGAGEADPFPIRLMVDSDGRVTIRHLLPGVYPACVEGANGPIRFDLDLTQKRPEIVVDAEY